MKISRFFAVLFGLIGICVLIGGLWLCSYAVEADTAMIETPESALEQVSAMMDSFCAGDYQTASTYLYGNPDLGVDRDPADEIGVMIWAAFEKSMTYELVGECYATDSGLSQNVRVTTMDISAVTAYLEENARILLEERALAAEDYDDIFDENDEYLDEFVQSVLVETTELALKNVDSVLTTELTLNLVWDGERWMILINDDLLRAVSGGIAK